VRWSSVVPSLIVAAALGAPLAAQPVAAAPNLLLDRFIRMTAVTGFEQAALDSVQRAIPGAVRDRAGNVVLDRGSGPATLIACPFDEVGYVVGGIRADGWLTLRRVGARAPNALWDQYHEGQRVTVFGRTRALPAVVGVRSTHLTRGRAQGDAPFTVDDAVVDIGASTAAEVRAAGVGVLAPVAMLKQVTHYGDQLIAGPWSGRRAACAALVEAARATPGQGRVVVAFLVEQELGQRGLRTLANRAGPFGRTVIVDGAAGPAGSLLERGDTLAPRSMPGLGTVVRLSLPTRNSATPVETVAERDITRLKERLVALIGGAQ
jgi:putative aminopeptidase FrvX